MSVVAVIPARFASTRFPGKPLAKDTGKFLIHHVYEQVARAATVDRVIVATDDGRVGEAVASFGGEWAMTRGDHPSGTDRVAEVAGDLDCDIVVNVQGDEPEIEPSAIDALVDLLKRSEAPVGTLACPFAALQKGATAAQADDPHCVKVAVANGRALYFSRYPIPFDRGGRPPEAGPYLHLGIYAYDRETLLELAKLEPTPLERSEGLEQLRFLEHGYEVAVAVVGRACVGIDTPEDYRAFVKRYLASASIPASGVPSAVPGPRK